MEGDDRADSVTARKRGDGGGQQLPDVITGTLLDFHELLRVARDRSAAFRNADPFPHVVIDGFLPEARLGEILRALPESSDPNIRWGNVNADLPDGRAAQKHKHHLQNVLYMQPVLRQLFFELNSGPFLLILRQLTGMTGLI